MAAVNKDFIHTSQTGNVSHLNNRSWNKCRGNFFPPGPKEGPRLGRFQSPTLAFHRAEAEMAPAQSVRAPAHRRAHRRTTRSPDRAKPRGRDCDGLVLRRKEDWRR